MGEKAASTTPITMNNRLQSGVNGPPNDRLAEPQPVKLRLRSGYFSVF